MEFKDYYAKLTKNRRLELATAAGVSVGCLNMLAYGRRKASAGLSIVIERETSGLVRCEVMRPDVDWAYIRGTSQQSLA